MPEVKTPHGLGKEGRRLWLWMSQNFTMSTAEPMAAEICRLADRLASIRAEIAKDPADMRLVNAEMKVCGAYARCWKTLGLADSEPKGRAGYPAGVPRRQKWGS